MKERIITSKIILLLKKLEFNFLENPVPTQSLVQKWLREKYKVEVVIGVDLDFTWKEEDIELKGESIAKVTCYTYEICFCEKYMQDNVISGQIGYKNWEDAFEKGLEEALNKLLEE